MSNKDQIINQLKSQIENFKGKISVEKVGTVVEIGDGIARISGLSECMSQEMIQFEGGQLGVALNLEEDTVGAMILGDYLEIKAGDQVK
ncbi:MAG: F0F1 ATP synthase subunit alpha, partial [Candidatus Komeilibacteria bacterium CG10_big_fil_rev_8_21_14_0_10_41_13]